MKSQRLGEVRFFLKVQLEKSKENSVDRSIAASELLQVFLRKSQMEGFSTTYQALAEGKPMAASDYLTKTMKRLRCLFTCLTARAVHVEAMPAWKPIHVLLP